jgi:uncharacterized membrane protein
VRDGTNRALTYLLAAALVLSVAGAAHVASSGGATSQPHTAFYVLGSEGNASSYPESLAVGEAGTVTVGLTNREQTETAYTLRVRAGNRTVTTRTLTLASGETWEGAVTFAPRAPGPVRVHFLLYRNASPPADDPYRRLWLRVNATESPGTATGGGG